MYSTVVTSVFYCCHDSDYFFREAQQIDEAEIPGTEKEIFDSIQSGAATK